jgi:hypothetical protein
MWLAAPASAKWASTSSGSGAAASTTIAAPGNATATCNSLLAASVKLSWPASSTPWVTQYEVRWGTNASAPTGSSIVTGLTFLSPALATGTWFFTVRSAAGAWRSPVSNQPSRVIAIVLVLPVCL